MQVDLRFDEDAEERRVGKQRTEFVLDGGTGFRPQPGRVVVEFALPEGAHHLVANARHEALSESLIVKEAQNVG